MEADKGLSRWIMQIVVIAMIFAAGFGLGQWL